MKIQSVKAMGMVLVATLATGFASVATYSGVYNIDAGFKVLLSVTKGGHILTQIDDTLISESLNPAKSTVNSNGKIVGSGLNGLSITGQIDPNFAVTGTVKGSDGSTIRISGKRFLK